MTQHRTDITVDHLCGILSHTGQSGWTRPQVLHVARKHQIPGRIVQEFLADPVYRLARGRYHVRAPNIPVKDVRSDQAVLDDVKMRFHMLGKLTQGTIDSNIRSLVVSGAPGVGKTYTVESLLAASTVKHEIVKGSLSAVELYKLGYRNRRPGHVVVLDDADSIFQDEEALNVLKALCDSGQHRQVSWLKDSHTLRKDDQDVPQHYDFQGSFIFISNLDFQRFLDHGKTKMMAHFEALMSRSLYLDLRLHDRQAVQLWVEHVATTGKLFQREGVSEQLGRDILTWLQKHRDDLREYSIRTVVKVAGLAKTHPQDWIDMTRVLLCRN